MTTEGLPLTSFDAEVQRAAASREGVSPARPVTINRVDWRIQVSGMPRGLIESLGAPHKRPQLNADCGLYIDCTPRPLFRSGGESDEADGVYWGSAALMPLMTRVLDRAGIPFRIGGLKPSPLPEPVLERFGAAKSINLGLFQAIQAHDILLVRYGDPIDFITTAIQIARAWPQNTIIFAVPRIDQAGMVRRRLRAIGVDAVEFTSKGRQQEATRVAVTTFGQLGRAEVGLHRADLVVVLDAIAARGDRPQEFLAPDYTLDCYRVPRLVGFLPMSEHLKGAMHKIKVMKSVSKLETTVLGIGATM